MIWKHQNVLVFLAAILNLAQAAQIPTEVLEFYGGGNGDSCPPNTEPSGTQYSSDVKANTCGNGDYIGKQSIPSSSKCCFEPDQKIFLLSIAGKATPAQYTFDSVECCSEPDEIAVHLANGRCLYGPYGAYRTGVPQKYVTKCCFNKQTKNFHVHLQQFQPTIDEVVSFDQSGNYPAGCNLGYNVHVSRVRVYGNRLEADIAVSIDCGPYKGTSTETVQAFLKKGETHAGELKYVISGIGPTVYVNLYTKIKDDFSVILRGVVTGSGVLGRLHEQFDKEIDNDEIKSILAGFTVC